MRRSKINTPGIEDRVLMAAFALLRKPGLRAEFKHGRWIVTHPPTGARWCVSDGEGPSSADGFQFIEMPKLEEE